MRYLQENIWIASVLFLSAAVLLTGCPQSEIPQPPARQVPASPERAKAATTEKPAQRTEAREKAPAATPAPTEGQPAAAEAQPAPPRPATPEPASVAVSQPAAAPKMPTGSRAPRLVPLPIELPSPAFRGTPKPLNEPNVEEPSGKPRPPFLAPEGTINLARGRPVTASDPQPSAGELDLVTDGNKEASDFAYLELRPGTQWVQIDLGQKATIYAVLVWHNHAEARVYRDVIVQISDDPDFLDAVTVFNNDYDNSSGLGIGRQLGYVETSEGKLIDCKGVEGRYVRLYSRGNHVDGKNHYTEVEVYGRISG